MNEEQNQTPQAPEVPQEEMKMPENSTVVEDTHAKAGIPGPVILVLGLALLGVLIGLFLWFSHLSEEPAPVVAPTVERPTAEENNEPESTTAEAQTDTLEVVSTSDELSAIEADLESTDLDSLDTELLDIEAELEGSL